MMNKRNENDPIDTIYGRFTQGSKRRLDLTYDYEAAEIRAFRRIAERIAPTLVLDIGANIGVYSVFVAEIESIARIFAFEPAPASFDLLQRNIDLQKSTRLHCRNIALSEAAGAARFAIFGELAGNNAIVETAISSKAGSAETIEVATARLDDEVAATGETFMCKIDVEGHELQVVSGAAAFLANNAGVLQIECFNHTSQLDVLLEGHKYVRIFRMNNDYYYTNLSNSALRAALVEILFEEVAKALADLRDERRWRRRAIRTARKSFEQLRFVVDPVIGARDPAARRLARTRSRKE